MFGKKKSTSSNPEVQAAMDERDALIARVPGVVEKVDRLLQQYEQAEAERKRRKS